MITCQLSRPFSSTPGIQQESAQGMGKTDKLREVLKCQPFVPGRRSLKDLQMTENPRANTFSPAFFMTDKWVQDQQWQPQQG